MYDASKLTIKKEAEPKMVENFIQQKNMTQSFVSIGETQSYTYPRNMTEDNKRQTSTTAPPFRSIRQPKPQLRNETDLDDALGETLTQLSHRQAPIALQLMRER